MRNERRARCNRSGGGGSRRQHLYPSRYRLTTLCSGSAPWRFFADDQPDPDLNREPIARHSVMQVTYDFSGRALNSVQMHPTPQPESEGAIERLVRVGQHAGVRIEDMLRILSAGGSVETLLNLIERNLQGSETKLVARHNG